MATLSLCHQLLMLTMNMMQAAALHLLNTNWPTRRTRCNVTDGRHALYEPGC